MWLMAELASSGEAQCIAVAGRLRKCRPALCQSPKLTPGLACGAQTLPALGHPRLTLLPSFLTLAVLQVPDGAHHAGRVVLLLPGPGPRHHRGAHR